MTFTDEIYQIYFCFTEPYQELLIIMLTLTQLQCVDHHDICHTLHIAEYNQTKITLSCDQSDHSQFIIQTSYSHFKINPEDLSCSQFQHKACYPTIETINHIQYNNGNEN